MIPVQRSVVGNALLPIVLLPAPDQLIQDNDEQPANALAPSNYNNDKQVMMINEIILYDHLILNEYHYRRFRFKMLYITCLG